MVLSIFLSMISIFNNMYVIILIRKITKISAFMSTYLLVCRCCISSQWIAEEIDEKKSPLLFLMNPEFHNKRTVLTPSFRRSKRSGEISHRSRASPMVAGDLSAQRFNRDEYLSPITTGSPLEMTIAAGRIHSFPWNLLTKTLPRTSSFRPKRSGVKKSHAEVRRPHGGRRSLGSAFQ